MRLPPQAAIWAALGVAACQPHSAAQSGFPRLQAQAGGPESVSAPQTPPPAASSEAAAVAEPDSAKEWARPKRAIELDIAYRITDDGEVGNATSFQVQPMLFWNRRIMLGTRFGIDPIVGEDAFASYELDLYAGYQHYLSNWAVPYARAIVGAASQDEGGEEREDVVNYGGEVGIKLYTSRSFYASLAAGSSRTAPAYGSLGIGIGLRMGHGGGNPLKAAIFVPLLVGLAAALVPWGVDRAVN